MYCLDRIDFNPCYYSDLQGGVYMMYLLVVFIWCWSVTTTAQVDRTLLLLLMMNAKEDLLPGHQPYMNSKRTNHNTCNPPPL